MRKAWPVSRTSTLDRYDCVRPRSHAITPSARRQSGYLWYTTDNRASTRARALWSLHALGFIGRGATNPRASRQVAPTAVVRSSAVTGNFGKPAKHVQRALTCVHQSCSIHTPTVSWQHWTNASTSSDTIRDRLPRQWRVKYGSASSHRQILRRFSTAPSLRVPLTRIQLPMASQAHPLAVVSRLSLGFGCKIWLACNRIRRS